jgi:hypothetical protein
VFVCLLLEPNSLRLQPGELANLRAIALTRAGGRVDVTTRGVRFSSSAPAVATVDASGLVVARARGQAEVEVRFESLRATARVFVARGGPFSLRFEPARLDVRVGEIAVYRLERTSAEGEVEDLTLDPSVTYTLPPDAPFTIEGGRLSALRVGEGTLEARLGDVTARLDVVVRPPIVAVRIEPELIAMELGGQTSFRVALEFVPSSLTIGVGETRGVSLVATLADGSRLDVTYEPSVLYLGRGVIGLAIESVSGLFSIRSSGAGSGSVTATYDGLTAVLLVTVVNPLVGLAAEPSALAIEAGTVEALSIDDLYADGTRGQLLGVTLTSAAPGIARLSGAGFVTGVSVGSTTIRATRGSLFVDVPVEVTPPRPALTTLQPAVVAEGSSDQVVEVVGQNFAAGDVARVEAIDVATQVITDQRLRFTLPAARLAQAATLSVDVRSARGNSNALPLLVGSAPRARSASPDTLIIGGSVAVTLFGSGLAGVTPTAPGLTFVADGNAPDGQWARWRVTVAPNEAAGLRTIILTSPFGQAALPIALVAPGALSDLTVNPGQTLTLSGTQLVRTLRIELGGRVVAVGPQPLVFLASQDIEVLGEFVADGAPGSFDGGDAGGAGAGGGAGVNSGAGSPGVGGRGAPMGMVSPSPGLGGAGGGEGAGLGAISACAGGGGGGFGGRGGDGGQAGLLSGGAAGGLGSNGRGGTGGGGGAPCAGQGAVLGGSGGGGGGGGVLVLAAVRGGAVRIASGGVVSADGGAGGDVPLSRAGGGGGGGSGGRIELSGPTIEVTGVVRARGGRGGQGQGAGDGGGGGGGGYILIDTRPGGRFGGSTGDISSGAAGRAGPGLGSAQDGGFGVSQLR